MKIETEDLTQKLSDTEEKFLTANIIEKYERFDEQRSLQLTDIKLVRDATEEELNPPHSCGCCSGCGGHDHGCDDGCCGGCGSHEC